MASAAVESSFDIAYWFVDKALDDNEYLQPQKLHRLMYLAQAYFAVAYQGRALMPACFVADQFGPVEPNVFRACAIQRPAIEQRPLPPMVDQFLESVWRRFGPLSAEALNRQIAGHAPYRDAWAKGARSEISLRAMIAYYGAKSDTAATSNRTGAPPVEQVVRPRLMVSQDGKPVAVKKWAPKAVPKG